MKKEVYFIFEYDTNGTYRLDRVVDKFGWEDFLESLREDIVDIASDGLDINFEDCAYLYELGPKLPDNIDNTLKSLRKYSNECRLTGNFSSFISNNNFIHMLREEVKKRAEYDKIIEQNRSKDFVLSEPQKEQLDEYIQDEVNRCAYRYRVFRKALNITDECVVCNFYVKSGSTDKVGFVSFNKPLDIAEYPAWSDFLSGVSLAVDRAETKLRNAQKHYNACKMMLDDCKEAPSTPKFKKDFKRAVDAYYAMKKAKKEMEAVAEKRRDLKVRIIQNFEFYCSHRTIRLNDVFFEYGRSKRFEPDSIDKFFGEPVKIEECIWATI